MRCYNCNKEFDYEKYYGICPKCGCYNKKVSAEEQHRQYHDQYDGGYRHREEAPIGSSGRQSGTYAYGPSQGYVQVTERKNTEGGTVFLLISVVFLISAVLFGTLGENLYEKHLEAKMRKGDAGQEVLTEYHELGEEFSFQMLTLKVEEARTLADWEELDIPEGKKLVAVKLSGSGGGEWADHNRISETYVRCNGICYPQISDYEFKGAGDVYRTPALDLSVFCWEEEAQGWIAFLVEEDAQEITFCMEERVDERLAFITAVHAFKIELKEGTDE